MRRPRFGECAVTMRNGTWNGGGNAEDAADDGGGHGAENGTRADWAQTVELCRAVADELDDLVPGVVARIRAEVAEYAPVPLAEHRAHVRAQFAGLLDGLATRRAPNAEQTEAARELGRQRARQGVPVEAMIGAYHIGYREMWNVLLARADAYGTGLGERLVRLVNLVWTWVRLVSSAAADAHAEELRSQQALQISIGHRFLDALRAGEDTADETVFMARALGFDPDGAFQAVCAPASRPDDGLDPLRRRLDAGPGTVCAAARGAFLVIVVQGADAHAVAGTVRTVLPDGPLGVGLRRRGLGGAVASIVDAEHALAAAASDDRVAYFEQDWLTASLHPQRHRLAPLLGAGRRVAGPHPHLADAVRAFAANGFSVTASARALHLHPNTVKYRLDRWRELTGWDPRTPDGLVRSLLSLDLDD